MSGKGLATSYGVQLLRSLTVQPQCRADVHIESGPALEIGHFYYLYCMPNAEAGVGNVTVIEQNDRMCVEQVQGDDTVSNSKMCDNVIVLAAKK